MNAACSWKQLIVLTMFACTFVSMIILAVVCGNLAPVYSCLSLWSDSWSWPGRDLQSGEGAITERGERRCDEPPSVAPQASDLSPLQKLLQHLAGLHYATIPCSFLSDIKGWCEFYWTPKPRADVLPSIWPIAENSRWRGMWKCTIRWGGEMMCYTRVFHNKHSHSHQAVGCRAVWPSLQCTGAKEGEAAGGEVRRRACGAMDQVCMLALMA